uniref:Uncharacterized protein n=1 Tax=Myoviridae sp. ctkfK18 TaxID=2825165 RepID=A0A8S5VH54_9CAUD|nr:MAG TPA: hypothetical protein [Myoviridae sp. ctkfK18]
MPYHSPPLRVNFVINRHFYNRMVVFNRTVNKIKSPIELHLLGIIIYQESAKESLNNYLTITYTNIDK